MSYLCNQFFHSHFHFHNNQLYNLIETDTLDLLDSLRVFLSFCLIFCQFQPSVTYKSVAYKKRVHQSGDSVCPEATEDAEN